MNRLTLVQYTKALLILFVISLLLSEYLFLRRGYYNLYILNKVIAGGSFIAIGILLLLGPLSRLYQVFDKMLLLRKELGVIAFILALLHSVISLFFLPGYFPLENFFKSGLLTFALGLSGIMILFLLFAFSFEKVIEKIDRTKWWRMQNYGIRIAAFLAFLHVFIMKLPGWISWYEKGGAKDLAMPFLPPGSLIVASFGFLVLVVRISDRISQRLAKVLTPLSFIALVMFWIASVFWGLNKG